ncbi:hypothetical protein EDF60_1587 [Leucobacter luti]|nr:hypothetical protein EDF60_1587 [Leucobacter luti]
MTSEKLFESQEGIEGEWDLEERDSAIAEGAALLDASPDQFELDFLCDVLPRRENFG